MPHELQTFGRIFAIEPSAFVELLAVVPQKYAPPENQELGETVIVTIRGALSQYANDCRDSYEGIRARVDAACLTPAKRVLLRIDTPGGDAAGAFEAAAAIKAACQMTGKDLIAYVEGRACSAGYAFASVASKVYLASMAYVGSIGIITPRRDYSAALAQEGVRVEFIASGARKSDGNTDAPITDAELAATQKIIDSMAAVFFGFVAQQRGMSPADVAAQQAGTFHGPSALAVGLADGIFPLDQVVAGLVPQQAKETPMDYEKMKAELTKAAESDDAEVSARAKRMLAAMEPPKKKGDDTAADDDDDDDAEKKAAAAAAAAAVSAATSGELATTVQALSAKVAHLETRNESTERSAFLATRPDLSEDLLKVLEGKPLAEVKAIVGAIKPPAVPNRAATAAVTGTRGETQGDPLQATGADAAEMDARMGLTETTLGVRRERKALVFGVMPKPATESAANGGGK